jgi:hypothetical protein
MHPQQFDSFLAELLQIKEAGRFPGVGTAIGGALGGATGGLINYADQPDEGPTQWGSYVAPVLGGAAGGALLGAGAELGLRHLNKAAPAPEVDYMKSFRDFSEARAREREKNPVSFTRVKDYPDADVSTPEGLDAYMTGKPTVVPPSSVLHGRYGVQEAAKPATQAAQRPQTYQQIADHYAEMRASNAAPVVTPPQQVNLKDIPDMDAFLADPTKRNTITRS